MKNVLITGGAGFIGSNLANYFFKNNYNILFKNINTDSENSKNYKENFDN